MDIIKNILTENELFGEGDITGNKIDEFINEYNNEITINLNNLKRDKNGFIELKNIPYIKSNIKLTGHSDSYWILLSDKTKLLMKKPESIWSIIKNQKYDYEIIQRELLMQCFLEEVGMEHANYDVAINHDNDVFLITPSFLKKDEKLINPFKNFESIPITYNECQEYNIEDFYLKTLFVDRICGISDRSHNFSIIENINSHTFRPAPLFDNGDCSLVRENHYLPGLNNEDWLINIPDNTKNSMEEVINYLLNYEVIINFIKNNLYNVCISSYPEKIYKDKHIEIESAAYNQVKKYFIDSENIINDVLKSRGIKERIYFN